VGKDLEQAEVQDIAMDINLQAFVIPVSTEVEEAAEGALALHAVDEVMELCILLGPLPTAYGAMGRPSKEDQCHPLE